MPESGFNPEGYSVEKERKNWIDKVEKINDKGMIESILNGLGIVITEPFKDFRDAREALQSFIRGFNKSQLENLEAVVRQIEEKDEEL